MTSFQLQNYLRTNRKRLGLSQEDVAFLLGTQDGSQVSRYERLTTTPNLETALAFEVIYRISTRKLFAGLYERIEKEVTARAETLAKKLDTENPTTEMSRKRNSLTSIISPQANQLLS